MMPPPRLFDTDLLRRRRARAVRLAAQVQAPDFLLTDAVADLIDRLTVVKRRFPRAAIVGAHHGLLGRALAASGRVDSIVEIDSAPEMLAMCAHETRLWDEATVPLPPSSLDLIASALSFQHINDLPGVLAQCRHALAPDGLLLVSMLAGETLTELRQALLLAETECDGGASPRIAPFADGRDLAGLLQRAGFALPVVDSDRITVAYRDPLALMRDLRGMGATNVLVERSRKPLRRATLARACERYAERFARSDGRLLATFEIVTLTAWTPHESQQKPLKPGSASHRLADALGTHEVPSGDKPGSHRKS